MNFCNWAGGMMGYGSGWVFMIIFWLIVIAVVIVLIRAIFGAAYREDRHYRDERGYREDVRPRGTGVDAMEILKERYARGEITKAQYDDMRKDLEAK